MNKEIQELNKKAEKYSEKIKKVHSEINKVIVGQEKIVEKLLIALISNGHVLIEGVPGLAKTLMIKTLSECLDCSFVRLQFTPDLLPADITGTKIYNHKDISFKTVKGPIFTNFILADEINRAPPKVQSALLEAMQEKQVSIQGDTNILPKPFMVLATQNPIESEGTYKLPEAQVDRFMFKMLINYPTKDNEIEINTSSRSSIKSALQDLRDQIYAIATLTGAKVTEGKPYPGWKPNLDSKLLKLSKNVSSPIISYFPFNFPMFDSSLSI